MFGFNKKKELTALQTAFLEALRDPANKGDLKKCREAAGYPKTSSIEAIIRPIKDEILEIARDVLAGNSVKASLALVRGVDDFIEPGIKELTTNAEKILDRVGIVRGEVIKVENSGGRIAIIPARDKSSEISD